MMSLAKFLMIDSESLAISNFRVGLNTEALISSVLKASICILFVKGL